VVTEEGSVEGAVGVGQATFEPPLTAAAQTAGFGRPALERCCRQPLLVLL
jgi:hypothetical protein